MQNITQKAFLRHEDKVLAMMNIDVRKIFQCLQGTHMS